MGAAHAYDVKQWRKEWKRGAEHYDTIRVNAPVEQPLPDLMVEMTEFALTRVRAISQHAEAKLWLGNHWPSDLPTPKQGYTTSEQLVIALDLLDACEKIFSLPFVADPRSQAGVHMSQLDRSNGRGLA